MHPQALYNETHQTRAVEPTAHESLLGDSIERDSQHTRARYAVSEYTAVNAVLQVEAGSVSSARIGHQFNLKRNRCLIANVNGVSDIRAGHCRACECFVAADKCAARHESDLSLRSDSHTSGQRDYD